MAQLVERLLPKPERSTVQILSTKLNRQKLIKRDLEWPNFEINIKENITVTVIHNYR